MKQPAISTANLSVGYTLRNNGEKVVHKSLNLELWQGELTCLLGLNGSGKSTLLRTLAGFQTPLSGSIYLNGKLFSSYSEEERSLLIGVVLTDKVYAGGLTVYEMVTLGRYPHTGFWGRLRKCDHEMVEQAIRFANIAHLSERYFSELSDGEKQKVMIAKALAQECPVILLDEPTAFLDINSRIDTMSLLLRMTRIGKTILLSTHDIDIALQLADTLWLLDKEKDFVCGAPEDLVMDGVFSRFFGGNGVVFDTESGIVRIEPDGVWPVYIKGRKTMRYWISNALNRNGFRAVLSPEESEIHIEAKEYPQMDIHRNGEYLCSVYSVEELVKRLRLMEMEHETID